ncbi:MAG: hypothetical protein AAF789_10360, partial [Bacteroidota bacterium]
EENDFTVLLFSQIDNERAQTIQQTFIATDEISLSKEFNRTEIDSIRQIPGRRIKSRALKKDGKIVRNEEGVALMEYVEEKLQVEADSIGHIFAATSSNLLANNFISLAEVRSDSIGIVGYDDWLDFSLMSYEQLQRIGVYFISPLYVDSQKESAIQFKSKVEDQLYTQPSQYHHLGYELVLSVGRLLNEHGVYFQKELPNDYIFPGSLMQGIEYGSFRDNQVVPINVLQDFSIIRKN